jgi:hypothetical protein
MSTPTPHPSPGRERKRRSRLRLRTINILIGVATVLGLVIATAGRLGYVGPDLLQLGFVVFFMGVFSHGFLAIFLHGVAEWKQHPGVFDFYAGLAALALAFANGAVRNLPELESLTFYAIWLPVVVHLGLSIVNRVRRIPPLTFYFGGPLQRDATVERSAH